MRDGFAGVMLMAYAIAMMIAILVLLAIASTRVHSYAADPTAATLAADCTACSVLDRHLAARSFPGQRAV